MSRQASRRHPQQDQDILALRGKDLICRDGDKLGTIEEIYLDAGTDQPHWALIATGAFGTGQSFVPIAGAIREGGRVHVPLGKATVKDAPKVEPDDRLSDREEAALRRHYRLNHGGGDDAMARPEEEFRAGTRERESGRVRLKKYVVEDEVTDTVPGCGVRSYEATGSAAGRRLSAITERGSQ